MWCGLRAGYGTSREWFIGVVYAIHIFNLGKVISSRAWHKLMHAIHGNPEDANGMEVNTHGGFQQGASKGSKEGGKGKTDYFNLVKGGRASLQKGDGKKEDGKQTGKFKHQYYYHQQYQSQEEPRKAFSSKSRSRLIPTQWSAPVVDSKFLDRKGGVAIVKEH